jgi:DNA-binding SARP family transcriptional activator/Tfp pilus assembly protein PilF
MGNSRAGSLTDGFNIPLKFDHHGAISAAVKIPVQPELEFFLLGPLVVRSGTTVLAPPGKQRTVLAALLLNADRVVSVDELIEILWGDSPPPSARVTVQNHMMRLRKTLGRAAGSRLTTQPPGYRICVNADELDVSRFETHLNAACAAARGGEWGAAAAEARAGLTLWRGEPLADVDSELLASRQAPRLRELRMQAVETRIDADLHRGQHAEVIAELRQLVSADPLRENLHELLILALYRDGRRGDALAAYRQARRVLVDELAAEPGSRLQELHRQVLAADPALDVTSRASGAVNGSDVAKPRQLPGAVSNFAGRATELAALTRLLEQSGREVPATMVISAIGGTAGVGKTALAVQWAHQVADQFPDGQLYVNLRGYDPDQPVTAADALAGFLHALGAAGQDIPAGEADRAARYRTLLAGRRMLVVLDNARSAEQVRPLLPGDPACSVIVTSRDALTGLVATDGARRLDLDLLPLEDAVSLLRSLIGARVDADPPAAALLASQCCLLPLALRVAAELAAARPAIPLADLAGELSDRQRRLDLLDPEGDPRSAVRVVFSWSYRHLDAAAARAFRKLGIHPGPDLDPYAAAALIGVTLDQAKRLLGQLARAHLIQPATDGRYGLHDLLRAYARELAASYDDAHEQQAALTRLFDYYLHTASAAMDTLYPAEVHRRPRIAPAAGLIPAMSSEANALAWLGRERANLTAVAAHTAGHGWPRHAKDLAATLFRYLMTGSHLPEAQRIYSHALHAARRSGDPAAEAAALNGLGAADMRQGRYQQATGHYEQAAILFRKIDDRTGEARAITNLGALDLQQGHYQLAAGHLQRALALHRETGDRSAEAHALSNLGLIDQRQGRYRAATAHFEQALALCQETGFQAGEIHALCNLGVIDLRQGRYERATDSLQRALALCHETGDRSGEAYILVDLGLAGLHQGRYEQATGHIDQALALCRETGDKTAEAHALNSLGEVFLATGQPGDASARHATALDLADQTGYEYEQARAHSGLARASHAAGEVGRARQHWQEALVLYTKLGAPEAGEIRTHLAASDD